MAVSQISTNIVDRPPLVLANHLLPLRVLLPDHLPALICLPTLPSFLPFLDNLRLLDESARRKVDVFLINAAALVILGMDDCEVVKTEEEDKKVYIDLGLLSHLKTLKGKVKKLINLQSLEDAITR